MSSRYDLDIRYFYDIYKSENENKDIMNLEDFADTCRVFLEDAIRDNKI